MLHKIVIYLSIICIYSTSFANSTEDINCHLEVSGRVKDDNHEDGFEFASVYILETEKGVSCDSLGNFKLQNICPGTYTFRISHIGCTTIDSTIKVKQSIHLEFQLKEEAQILEEAVVTAHKNADGISNFNEYVKHIDLKDPSKDLGEILTSVSGINTLQTGTNIFKPVIHGFHSDRIVILQNDIKLSGQSWGADHAPELDAASAASIQIIKGAGGIEYGTDALGGIITVHQNEPDYSGKWSGQVNVSQNTNSWGSALHAHISKGWKIENKQKIAFQVGSTYKKSGDAKAPDYVISNSGMGENDSYAQFSYQKQFDKTLMESHTFYNYYYRKNGILASAHIGNIEDLQLAIQSSRPLVVNDWSYSIGYPYQQAVHHTMKQEFRFHIPWGEWKLQYDFQNDQRKEFDNRRSGRSDIPVFDVQLNTQHIAAKFNKTAKGQNISTGIDYYLKNNKNIPGTGFQPVIPDYTQNIIAVWGRWQKTIRNLDWDAGLRYEFQDYDVATFDSTNHLIRPQHQFHNFAITASALWRISKVLQLNEGFSISSRAPNIHELYSKGVHTSAAAIEYGDATMIPEISFKWLHQFELRWNNKAHLNITPYLNFVKNYIYLQPQKEFELTIRGAFPVFRYEQVRMASIMGIDADITFYPIVDLLKLQGQYNFIRMKKIGEKNDLISTPPNQLKLSAGIEKSYWKKLQNIYAGLEWKYVGEQFHVLADEDFSPPPSAYHLLSFNSNIEWTIHSKTTMGAGIQLNNMTNQSYRDYLDRLRYFSDLQGFNFIFKWYFKF